MAKNRGGKKKDPKKNPKKNKNKRGAGSSGEPKKPDSVSLPPGDAAAAPAAPADDAAAAAPDDVIAAILSGAETDPTALTGPEKIGNARLREFLETAHVCLSRRDTTGYKRNIELLTAKMDALKTEGYSLERILNCDKNSEKQTWPMRVIAAHAAHLQYHNMRTSRILADLLNLMFERGANPYHRTAGGKTLQAYCTRFGIECSTEEATQEAIEEAWRKAIAAVRLKHKRSNCTREEAINIIGGLGGHIIDTIVKYSTNDLTLKVSRHKDMAPPVGSKAPDDGMRRIFIRLDERHEGGGFYVGDVVYNRAGAITMNAQAEVSAIDWNSQLARFIFTQKEAGGEVGITDAAIDKTPLIEGRFEGYRARYFCKGKTSNYLLVLKFSSKKELAAFVPFISDFKASSPPPVEIRDIADDESGTFKFSCVDKSANRHDSNRMLDWVEHEVLPEFKEELEAIKAEETEASAAAADADVDEMFAVAARVLAAPIGTGHRVVGNAAASAPAAKDESDNATFAARPKHHKDL
ncbi:MAG: hypothetical protein K0U29_04015 [Gammaproteobacteria bacterium]|nr:hypothetical protein [Gammaproteobacteria bacterium]MCH9744080.1 hypothetical protein [Gammaproteobacteria bacterium]